MNIIKKASLYLDEKKINRKHSKVKLNKLNKKFSYSIYDPYDSLVYSGRVLEGNFRKAFKIEKEDINENNIDTTEEELLYHLIKYNKIVSEAEAQRVKLLQQREEFEDLLQGAWKVSDRTNKIVDLSFLSNMNKKDILIIIIVVLVAIVGVFLLLNPEIGQGFAQSVSGVSKTLVATK